MIHTLLDLTRPLVIFDTETTGVDPNTDRIIELGFEVWESSGMTSSWRSLINPGLPIPPDSTEIHHLTNDMMLGCRICGRMPVEHPVVEGGEMAPSLVDCPTFHPIPAFKEIAVKLAKGFSGCDFGGKNVRFDLRIIQREFIRAGVPWSYGEARVIDGERLEQLAIPRSLSDLYQKYTGEKLDGAHGALTDVMASRAVICGQMREHSAKLPRDLDALHKLQWPNWIDPDGKFRFVKGVACFGYWGKFANRPMNHPEVNSKDRRGQTYWDFILSSDFAPEVKKLASDAKLGKFPTQEKTQDGRREGDV